MGKSILSLWRQDQRGISLIELMIAVACTSIMVYVLGMALVVGSSQAGVLGTKMTLQDSAREGMLRMLQGVCPSPEVTNKRRFFHVQIKIK